MWVLGVNERDGMTERKDSRTFSRLTLNNKCMYRRDSQKYAEKPQFYLIYFLIREAYHILLFSVWLGIFHDSVIFFLIEHILGGMLAI